MPIIKDEEQLKQYTTTAVTNKLFRERLEERFRPSDFVRVINIDDEPFIWQYMSSADEDVSTTSDGMHRIITRKAPQVWMVDPGETEVIQGDNAYVMIEALYKKITAKKIVNKTPNQSATMARNFNFSDPIAQEEMIDRIYLGKENPMFGVKNEEPLGTTGRDPASKATTK